MINKVNPNQTHDVALEPHSEIDPIDKLILDDFARGIADIREGRLMSVEELLARSDARFEQKLRALSAP